MHSHKKIVNIICVLIAMLSLMAAFAVRAEEEPNTTPAHTTEAPTEAPTTHTRSHKATEPPTEEETEPSSDAEKTDGSYIDYEPKPDSETSGSDSDEDEDRTEEETTEEVSKHEGGTKSTRAALYEITTTTTTTTAVEKNINDYGKKYGWIKWICYVFVLGSVVALIVYNVKCHQLKAVTAGQGSTRSRSARSGSDIRSTSRTATRNRNQRNDRNNRR